MSRYRDRDWPDYGPSRSLDHFDNYNHKHPRHPSSVANGWYDDIMDRSSDRGRGFSGRYPPPESYSAPYGGRGSPQLKPRWPQQPGYNDAIKQRSKPPAKVSKTKLEGILPKGPYLPCVSMAGRAILAGYPLNVGHISIVFFSCDQAAL